MLHQINEGSDIISDKWWINESVEYVGFEYWFCIVSYIKYMY